MTGGVLSLPNQCVREENIGTGMIIAINVENPNLVEWALNAVTKLPRPSLPLPEVLVAIMPSALNNQISDPHCLADLANRIDTQKPTAEEVKPKTQPDVP